MKKDILSDWLREFCMLVFIQSVQAFIFAIVMGLLVSLLSFNNLTQIDAGNATSLMAVFLLASVSKIEDIVKKVFGIKSNVHDSGMRGGLKSLATTMMAANLAKGVGDNLKKVTGGVVGAVGANKAIALNRTRMARDVNRYNKPPTSSSSSSGPGLKAPTAGEYMDKAKEAKSKGDMLGYERNRGIAAGIRKSEKSVAAASPSSSASNSSDNQIKLQEKMDAYDDKIRELKQKRRNSVISGASGLFETAGALVGGTAGMVGGAALGEGKEIVQGGLAGMGVGDAAGKAAVSVGSAPIRVAASTGEMLSDIGKIRSANQELQKEVSAFNSSAKDAIQSRDRQIKSTRQAKKKLNEELKNIDAGNMDL